MPTSSLFYFCLFPFGKELAVKNIHTCSNMQQPSKTKNEGDVVHAVAGANGETATRPSFAGFSYKSWYVQKRN